MGTILLIFYIILYILGTIFAIIYGNELTFKIKNKTIDKLIISSCWLSWVALVIFSFVYLYLKFIKKKT